MELLVIAKQPVAGRAKTRLIPGFGATGSAELATAALLDTFDAAAACAADRVVVAFDGDPTGLVPDHFEVVPQVGGPLERRLEAAWRHVRGPALQIGMDTPQLTGNDLDAAFARLSAPDTDAVLGPAVDGGWWAIGFTDPTPGAFDGVTMSRPDTGTQQLARLAALGLRTSVLEPRRDVDQPDDVAGVAAEAPRSRFAATARRLMAEPRLRAEDGTVIPLSVETWSAPASDVEHLLLAEVRGPVIDIGCGPGRLVVALAERGVPVLGVDASPAAVQHAHQRRAPALLRSVFDHLPGTGRWATALLFDGNIGIGGDPVRLLRRVRELLARDGRAVVETGAPDTPTRSFPVQVERGSHRSPWFPWAQVGADGIGEVAHRAGLGVLAQREVGGRWFAELAVTA